MELSCYNNQLTDLDVSKNTKLTHLYFYTTQLTSLDISKNPALIYLYCYNNQLTDLDISANPELTVVVCYNNRLSLLDLYSISEKISATDDKRLGTQTLALQTLPVGGMANFPAALGDTATIFKVTKNGGLPALLGTDYTLNEGKITFLIDGNFTVTMTNNAITSNYNYPAEVIATFLAGTGGNRSAIDFTWSAGTSQKYILITATNGKTLTIDWGDDDVQQVTANGYTQYIYKTYSSAGTYKVSITADAMDCNITDFDCNNKNVTDLDVSAAVALTKLNCSNNQLTNLDISKNTILTYLDCQYNQLTDLNVSGATALTYLQCYGNKNSEFKKS
jgi:Leucine-rich repeat (LRR) protein